MGPPTKVKKGVLDKRKWLLTIWRKGIFHRKRLKDDEIGIAEFSTEEIFSDKILTKDFPDTEQGEKGGTLKIFKETDKFFLKVKITDIVSHDIAGDNEIFFRCFQDGNQIKESDVIVGNYLSFKPFEVIVADIEKPNLQIVVYDKDVIGKDEIGYYDIDVKTLKSRGVVRGVIR